MLKKIRWNRMKLLALNAQTERKKIIHTNSGWKRTKMCKNGAKGQGRRQQAEQLQKKKKYFTNTNTSFHEERYALMPTLWCTAKSSFERSKGKEKEWVWNTQGYSNWSCCFTSLQSREEIEFVILILWRA